MLPVFVTGALQHLSRTNVDIMSKHGCTDAVFTHIGPGALNHLERAGIRGWIGPEATPVPELLESFRRRELAQAQARRDQASTDIAAARKEPD